MFTLDRINALRLYYGQAMLDRCALALKEKRLGEGHLVYVSMTPAHDAIDELDKVANLSTRGEYVGVRLALHEAFANKPPGKVPCECGYCRIHSPSV